MGPFLFTKAILDKKPINIFNNGDMFRDFTYIEDIVESIYHCYMKPAIKNKNFYYLNPTPESSFAPHQIFNIGNGKPIKLLDFIETLEDVLEIKAIKFSNQCNQEMLNQLKLIHQN